MLLLAAGALGAQSPARSTIHRAPDAPSTRADNTALCRALDAIADAHDGVLECSVRALDAGATRSLAAHGKRSLMLDRVAHHDDRVLLQRYAVPR